MAEVKNGKGVDDIVGLILSAWKASGAYEISRQRHKSEEEGQLRKGGTFLSNWRKSTIPLEYFFGPEELCAKTIDFISLQS